MAAKTAPPGAQRLSSPERPAPPAGEPTFRSMIADHVQEMIEAGMPSQEAGQRTVQRLAKQGWTKRFLDEIAPQACVEIWMHSNRAARGRLLRGARVVRAGAIRKSRSYLTALYPYGNGRWLPLGKMRRPECIMARDYAVVTEKAAARTREMFDRILAYLKEDEQAVEDLGDIAENIVAEVMGEAA